MPSSSLRSSEFNSIQKRRALALELQRRSNVLASARLGVGTRRFERADVERDLELFRLILRADVDAAGADAGRLRVVEAHRQRAGDTLPETLFQLRYAHDGRFGDGLLATFVTDHEISAVFRSSDDTGITPPARPLHVERVLAVDRCDRGPFDIDGAHVVGREPQQTVLELQDFTGDAVTVLEHDHVCFVTVSGSRRSSAQQQGRRQESTQQRARLSFIPSLRHARPQTRSASCPT